MPSYLITSVRIYAYNTNNSTVDQYAIDSREENMSDFELHVFLPIYLLL